jgi:hypothetical protein
MVVVGYSISHVIVKMLMMFCLCCHGYFLYRKGQPLTRHCQLMHRGNTWFLQANDGSIERYQKMNIQFDAGLFLRLQLGHERRFKRYLVLFSDQLTKEERRLLYLGQLSDVKPKQKMDVSC